MAARVVHFKVEEGNITSEEDILHLRHPVILLFLTRATREQLRRELLQGEFGVCTTENRFYYKHRETGKLYYTQMEEEDEKPDQSR